MKKQFYIDHASHLNFVRSLRQFLNCEHLVTDVFRVCEYQLRKPLKKIRKTFHESLRTFCEEGLKCEAGYVPTIVYFKQPCPNKTNKK